MWYLVDDIVNLGADDIGNKEALWSVLDDIGIKGAPSVVCGV